MSSPHHLLSPVGLKKNPLVNSHCWLFQILFFAVFLIIILNYLSLDISTANYEYTHFKNQ